MSIFRYNINNKGEHNITYLFELRTTKIDALDVREFFYNKESGKQLIIVIYFNGNKKELIYDDQVKFQEDLKLLKEALKNNSNE